MGMRDIISELKQLLQKTPFNFQRGIMRTDSDNAPGFVTDLNNMEIVNGVAQRRKGTALVSNPATERHFYCIQEVEISGSRVLVGVDGTRQVIAYSDVFPEMDLYVRKHGVSKDFYIPAGNTYDKQSTDRVRFERGNMFFMWENSSYVYIENDFGDAVRINKFGFFRIGKETEQTIENVLSDILAHRLNDIPNFSSVLDVEVEIVTHKKQEEFMLIEDKFKRSAPIRGNVRFAYKNEAGNIGEFTDAIFVPSYKHVFVSRFPAESCKDGYIIASPSRVITTAESLSDSVYITKNNNYEYEQSSSYSGDTTVNEIGYQTLIYVNDIDSSYTTSKGVSSGKWYMFSAYDETTLKTYVLDPENSGKIFQSMNVYKSGVLAGEAGGTPTYVSSQSGMSIIELLDNRIPINYISLSKDLTASEFVIESDNSVTVVSGTQTLGYMTEVKTSLNVPKDNAIFAFKKDGSTILEFEGSVYKIQFLVKETIEETGNIRFIRTPSYALVYKSTFMFSASLVGFINRGFDCWELTSSFYINGINTKIEPDISTGKFQVINIDNTIDFNSCFAFVDNTSNQMFDWMSMYGQRFVVWNDGYIIAESQRGWKDQDKTSYYDFLYYRDGTRLLDKMVKIYSPICCLEYRRLRAYPYEIRELRKRITNIKKIVFNTHLFILQDTHLWVADQDRMLSSEIVIPATIYDIEKLSDGIVVFTSQGMFYVDKNLSVKDVVNGNNIYVKSSTYGGGAAFILSNNNVVYYIHMIIGDNKTFFPICEPISLQLQNVYWGTSQKMTYVNNTLYISTDTDVWGFSNGAWSKKYNFNNRKIYSVCGWKEELVVMCEDENNREYIPIINIGIVG